MGAAYVALISKMKCKLPSIPNEDLKVVRTVAAKLVDELTSFITKAVVVGNPEASAVKRKSCHHIRFLNKCKVPSIRARSAKTETEQNQTT